MSFRTNLRIPMIVSAALIAAPAAMAQTATQTTPAPAATSTPAPTAGATTYTDEQVRQFAKAALEVNKILADKTIAEADRTPKMVAAITAAGLTADQFNAIGAQMRTDAALNKRIQDAAATAQPAAAAATPSGSATPAPAASPTPATSR